MNKQTLVKVLALIVAVIMGINFVLFVLRRISNSAFWLITALSALVAYVGIPRIRKN